MDEEVRISKELMKTISEDTKSEILKLLQQRPMTSSEIARSLEKHVTTITEHLELLQKHDLVERIERPNKKWVYYKLTKNAERILQPRSYYRWVVILSVTFLVLFSGLISAGNSIPGDLLYGVKRSVEGARLVVASNSAQKAELHLSLAEERLKEIKAVLAKNDTSAVKSLASDYKNELEQAKVEINNTQGDNETVTSLIEQIDESTSKHIATLENVENKQPEVKNEIDSALNYTKTVHDNAGYELNHSSQASTTETTIVESQSTESHTISGESHTTISEHTITSESQTTVTESQTTNSQETTSLSQSTSTESQTTTHEPKDSTG